MADDRSPTIHIRADATDVRTGHVWTDGGGETHGQLRFGAHSDIVFHDPQQARDMAAGLGKLADAMEAESARAAAERDDSGRV